MACNPDFVQYIIDQCCDAGEIAVKKMMGDWCAYCDGVLFGLICDNNFYIKVTEPGRALLKEVILRPPYDGAKDYFYISDVDDRDYLASLIKATIPALPLVSHASVKSTADLIPHLGNPGNGEKHHGEPQQPDCLIAVDTMTWQR